MNTLSRNVAYWLLLVLSLVSAVVGGWLISSQLGTMTTTLLDGTATGIEVYVGQSLVVVGAAALGAGIVGLLLALALGAVKALLPPRQVVVEPVDWTAEANDSTESVRVEERLDDVSTAPDTEAQAADTEDTQDTTHGTKTEAEAEAEAETDPSITR